jgi:hypothetical protein
MKFFTRILCLGIVLCFVPLVLGQTKAKVPSAIKLELDAMVELCKASSGKPKKSPDLLKVGDFNGDKLPDVLLNKGAFVCEGAASTFSGSGGSEVLVFAGVSAGEVVPAYSGGAFDAKVETVAGQATVWLMLGGRLCGLPASKPRVQSEGVSCWRPLTWNAAVKKFQLASPNLSRTAK